MIPRGSRLTDRNLRVSPPPPARPARRKSFYQKSGEGRIRTSEGFADRFTVCSLWPLGNLPKVALSVSSRERESRRRL